MSLGIGRVFWVEQSPASGANSDIYLGVGPVPDNRCPLVNVPGFSEGACDVIALGLLKLFGLFLTTAKFLGLLQEHLVVSFASQLILGFDNLAGFGRFEDRVCQSRVGFGVILLQGNDNGE